MKNLKALVIFVLLLNACSPNPKKQSITANVIEYIKAESVNGKLNFENQLDKNKLYVADEIAYNFKEYAIYLWGSKVCEMGENDIGSAIKLYEIIHNTLLEDHYQKALRAGFKHCSDSN